MAKLLGVVLDHKLSFRSRVELVQSRGTKVMLPLSCISSPTFGLPHSYVRQLFQTVVVLQMEYGLPVRYNPVSSNKDTQHKGTVWVAKALGKVQCLAARVITSVLHTTATNTLNMHTNILPIHIRLNPSVFNAGVRLATLPPSHLLHRTVKHCRHVPCFHRSPIHLLFAVFPLLDGEVELIDPHLAIDRALPGALTTRIALDKDTVKKEEKDTSKRGGCCVYTDGSGFEGGVGGVAVVWGAGIEGATRTKHLGTMGEHTVFESEVVGAILALDIIKGTPCLTDIDIFTNCQPVITALAAPRPQPGQYLLTIFHTLHHHLLHACPSLKIRIHWVPVHIGITGNEAVDARAKEAAQGASSTLASRITTFKSPLPMSKAAVLEAGAKAFKARWIAEWTTSPHYHCITLFDDTQPSNSITRMYSNLSHPQCRILTQLRTSHIGLNSFLFRFRFRFRFHLAPRLTAPQCLVPETVSHYLLSCPRYHRERLKLVLKLRTARLTLRRHLAAKVDHKPILAFMRDTGRFPHYSL
jgi:ribonuclease HI